MSDGFSREIFMGRTRNGEKKVTIYCEDGSDRWFLKVGGAELQMPDPQFAFTAAVGWITGRVHYSMTTAKYPNGVCDE